MNTIIHSGQRRIVKDGEYTILEITPHHTQDVLSAISVRSAGGTWSVLDPAVFAELFDGFFPGLTVTYEPQIPNQWEGWAVLNAADNLWGVAPEDPQSPETDEYFRALVELTCDTTPPIPGADDLDAKRNLIARFIREGK